MATWFLSDAGRHAMGGQLVATSLLTAVAASSTAHAVGSWVQMHSATSFPVSSILVHLGKVGLNVAAANTQALFDVGIAANGAPANTETAIAQDIAIGSVVSFVSWLLPLSVPVDYRLSVRLRSAVASKSVTMGMWVVGGGAGLESGYKATTYGAVPASSRGTILTVPSAVNTAESAWTVISASTTSPMRFMVVGVAAPDTVTSTAADCLIDIGVGAAGAEAPVVSDIPCNITVNESIVFPSPLTFPVSIPAGSRLVARYRGTSIAAAAAPNLTVTGVS